MIADKDTKNQNAGQFIGDWNDYPKIQIPKSAVIRHTRDAAKIAKCIANKEQEYAMVLSLNLSLKVINARIVCIGSRNTATFCPASVFKGAILDGASEIIFIHNHPGGDLKPTKGDKKTFRKLLKGGKLLDINLIDSVIVHGRNYRSMVDGAK